MKMKCAIILFFALGALTAGCYVGARDEKETRYPKDPAPISASESKTAQEIAEANLKESAANSYVTTAIAAATGSPALVQLNEAEMYKDPTLIYREGRALFQNNCVGCHGHNGCGNVPRSTNFTDPGWQDNNSDNGIYSSIYNGKGIGNGGGAMPAYYNQLSPQQITYLISYLRAFRGRECNGLPTQADVERMTAARQNKR